MNQDAQSLLGNRYVSLDNTLAEEDARELCMVQSGFRKLVGGTELGKLLNSLYNLIDLFDLDLEVDGCHVLKGRGKSGIAYLLLDALELWLDGDLKLVQRLSCVHDSLALALE